MDVGLSNRGLAVVAGLFCSVAVSLTATAAEAPCDCERFRELIPYSSLASQVAALGMKAINADGNRFAFDSEWRSAYQLKLDADSLIPEHCKGRLRKHAERELVARYDLRSSSPITRKRGLFWDDYFVTYISAVDYMPTQCKWTGPNGAAAYFQCFEDERPARVQALNDQLKAGNYSAFSGVGGIPPGWTDNSRVYGAFGGLMAIGKDNPERAHEFLRARVAGLSTEEKLAFMSMLGSAMGQDYDNQRLELGGSHSKGTVSLETILRAAGQNFASGYPSTLASAGVCTDIASGLGEVAQDIGFKHVYVVDYTTGDRSRSNSAGMHATVIFQDPDKKRLYQFNYGSLGLPEHFDVRSLYQGPSDAAINYRVFKPAGGHVVTVQSEFGKFLTEVAGFDVRTLDPLAETRGSLIAAGTPLNSSGTLRLRAGYGTDGSGNETLFAAATQRYGEKTLFPGGVSLVLASRRPPVTTYVIPDNITSETNPEDTRLNMLYFQLEQHFDTPAHEFSPQLSAKIETVMNLVLAEGFVGKGFNPMLPQLDLRLTTGLKVEHHIGERFSGTYRLAAQIVPGISDIRVSDDPRTWKFRPYLNHLLFSAEGRLKLSRSGEGRAYLIAATTVLLDELGPKGRVSLGIATDKIAADIQVVGRLVNDSPLFVDGSGRKISVNVAWKPSDVLTLRATAERGLEEEATGKVDQTIRGSAELDW